jgi:hypothetical protein
MFILDDATDVRLEDVVVINSRGVDDASRMAPSSDCGVRFFSIQ